MVQRVIVQPRVDLRLAALFCGTVGLYDVLFVATSLIGPPILGHKIDIPFSDFLVFHAAARAFLDGKLAIIYDTNALTDFQNALYSARLPYLLGFRPFLYPPLWLIDLLPLGVLPVDLSVAVFLVLTAGLCAVALRLAGLRMAVILAVLTAPAAVWAVIAGQNTYLSVALLYCGMALLERRPVLAGISLGLLAYKPQLWILIPLALLAARAWRPLVAMAATVALLSLASLAVFGQRLWIDFIAATRNITSGTAAGELYGRVHTHMTTLLAAGKTLGWGDDAAMTLQLAGSALAIGAVAWTFARYPAGLERTAILATATFMVSPYTLNYDMLLLMPAAALLFLHPSPAGPVPGERAVYAALWLAPSACMALNDAGLPLMPLLILLFGLIAWKRLRMPSRELPLATAER